MTPAWVLDIFAAIMLVVAAVSTARLVAARAWRGGSGSADTDIAHLLMAIAMAGMLAPSLTTLPAVAWEVIFGLLTAWFAARVVRDAWAAGARALAGGHCAPHLVHSAAMLYMFLALGAPVGGGMTASSTQVLRYSTLAFAFALVLAGYSVWDIDQLSGMRAAARTAGVSPAGVALAGVPATAGAPLPSPGVTRGCRIALGVTMAVMLMTMI